MSLYIYETLSTFRIKMNELISSHVLFSIQVTDTCFKCNFAAHIILTKSSGKISFAYFL